MIASPFLPYRITEAVVAIKQMKNVFDDPIDATRAYREIHILRKLRHPAIVDLQNVLCPSLGPPTSTFDYMRSRAGHEAAGNLYLVFEYMDSDLQRILKFSTDPLGDMHVRFIMYQLLDGIRFIHENNVIHRDLKPANILVLCQTCKVKIADFGLSRVVGSDLIVSKTEPKAMNSGSSTATEHELPTPCGPIHSSASQRRPSLSTLQPEGVFPIRPVNIRRGLTRHVVTRWYRAPEIILLQPYTAAVDIWSIGCIFAELLGMCLASASKRRALFPGERYVVSSSIGTVTGSMTQIVLLPSVRVFFSMLCSCGELSAEDLFVPTRSIAAASATNNNASSNGPGKSLTSASQDENDHHDRILRQSYAAERSQLNVIFDVLGTPPDDDLAYLDGETAKAIRSMPKKTGLQLENIFRHCGADAIDLLRQMLQFDPNKRISAARTLDHPYFKELIEQGYLDEYDGRSLHPVKPMNADIEKVAESSQYLRDNVRVSVCVGGGVCVFVFVCLTVRVRVCVCLYYKWYR